MSGAELSAPSGYERRDTRAATVVAREDALADVLAAIGHCDTLHRWAERVPDAERFRGRVTAFGVRLPQAGVDVVVRHAQHGGLLAPLTGDLFRWPGRAPWELHVSQRLRAALVPTPDVVAYALYPAGLGFCRCDVATQRLPTGQDLPTLWRNADAATQEHILQAVVALLRALRGAKAVHEDLNVKNIYLATDDDGYRAFALDVDRVRFVGEDPTAANVARLQRSFRKAREQFGLQVDDTQLEALARAARESA